MIKRKLLQKKLAIAAVAWMLMLLLAASCVAQTSLDTSGSEAVVSPTPGLENAVEGANSSNTAASQELAAPELESPSGILNTGKPTYVWKGVADCKYYCLVVRDDLNKVVLKQWYDALDFSPAPGKCSVTPLQSLDPGDYKWSVQSWNCLYSKQSLEMDFAVCTSSSFPDKAILVSPKDTIGSKNPTFVWKTVNGCTQYCLKVANANNQNVPIFERCYDAKEVLSEQDCSITPGLDLAAGSYRWWIQTINCKGSGPLSNYLSFKLQNKAPGRSMPISPQGLISTNTPIFTWTAASSATKYNLQVEDSNSIVANEWYDAADVTQASRCSAFLPFALPDDDANYYWRIQAGNDAGNGPWSSWKEFQMVCAFTGPAKKKTRMR